MVSSTLIGKRLISEGDRVLEEKAYTKAIDKYLEAIKAGYFGGGAESRLCWIADKLNNNNSEIEEKNFPDNETIIDLGCELVRNFPNNLGSNELADTGYLLLINFIPDEEIPRDVRMWMGHVSYQDA